MRKIGILGGTFDPPHHGHLLIAEQVRDSCNLDEIWFVPTRIPPHKQGSNLCTDEDRIEMVTISIKGNSFFHLSLLEFDRKGPSYTVDTMKEIKRNFPDDQFFFIIGGDMVEYLPHWKAIDELLQLVTFIGVKRPGYTVETIFADKILFCDVSQLEISSSQIRDRIQQNRSVKYLLPEAVEKYIKERKLYGKR